MAVYQSTDSQSEALAAEFDVDIADDLPETLDWAAVERMRVVAKLLDDSIPIPGTPFKIGIDPIIGIAPVAGDIATSLLSLYIVAESARLGVSYGTLIQMLANISIDLAGGAIPILGDVFDAAWKANKRNMQLFIEDLAGQPPTRHDEETISIDIT